MKKTVSIFIILCLTIATGAAELTGPEIIKKVNDLMNQKSSKGTMIMTITTTSGQERTFEYRTYSDNYGEKNLMIYEEPQRVKGQKILMLNNADDIWAYFVRTKRVRKLATHAKKQKLEGSDFSYEDMGASNAFINDFTTELSGSETKDGQDCYKLVLTRKPGASTSYAKLNMWVRKDNFVPIVIEYYEQPDRLDKTLLQSDIKVIDNVPTGTKMVMINNNDQSKTTMVIQDIAYNIDLDSELFTERGLQK